jgi:hypothetical protein
MKARVAFATSGLMLGALSTLAAEWPQFRGPDRNGIDKVVPAVHGPSRRRCHGVAVLACPDGQDFRRLRMERHLPLL